MTDTTPFQQADVPVIYNLLEAAMSPDNTMRMQAEDRLKQGESRPGYLSLLSTIAASQEASQNARCLAAIIIRNSLQRVWRSGKNSLISAEEKVHLKAVLIENHIVENRLVAKHMAVLIGRVARFDCPHDWPELLPALFTAMQGNSNDAHKLHRSAQTLHYVLAELSNRRLLSSRKTFQAIASDIFEQTFEMWSVFSERVLQAHTQSDPRLQSTETEANCEVAVVLCKIVCRLLQYGFPGRLDSPPEVQKGFQVIFERIKGFTEHRAGVMHDESSTLEAMRKMHCRLSKLLATLQQAQPLSFVAYLPVFLPMFHSTVTNACSNPGLRRQSKFILHALQFLKHVVHCPVFQSNDNDEGEKPPSEQAVQGTTVVQQFFSKSVLEDLCRVLVSQLLVLSEEDLQEWEDAPEEFVLAQESSTDTVRTCAENLLLALMDNHTDILGPFVIDIMKYITEQGQAVGDLPALLRKDACYQAIGLCAYWLTNHINFPQWFVSTLQSELQATSPYAKVIRRRASWLVSCWAGEIPVELHATIYQSLIPLLQDSDFVVRLTTASAVRAMLDDWSFDLDVFTPFIPQVLQVMTQLITPQTAEDTDLQVLQLLQLLIQRAEDRVNPYTHHIRQLCEHVFEKAQGSSLNLLKTEVIKVVSELVQASSVGGEGSQELHTLALNLCQFGLRRGSDDAVYLQEWCLDLLDSTLKVSDSYTPAIGSLFPLLPMTEQDGFEDLRVVNKILTQYLLLGGEEFVAQYAQQIGQFFQMVIGNVRDTGTVWTLSAMDVLLQLFPDQAPALLEPVLIKIAQAVFNHEESKLIEANYVNIFARIALQNHAYFIAFWGHLQSSQPRADGYFAPFLRIWIDLWDNMGLASKRRMSALALCKLLVTQDQQVWSFFSEILTAVSSSLCDDAIDAHSEFETQILSEPLDEYTRDHANSSVRPGGSREMQLKSRDPVVTSDLRALFVEVMQQFRQLNGEQVFQQAMSTVDPLIVKSLESAPQAQTTS